MSTHKYSILFLIVFVLGINSVFAIKFEDSKKDEVLSLDDQRKFDYYFYDAMNSKSIGQYGASHDFLQYCMKIDSTNANVLFELGNFYSSIKSKDEAHIYYTKAAKYAPDNFYYNMALAGSSAEKQDYKQAAAIYQKLVDINPSKIELYMYLSEIYRLDGDLPNSLQALNDLERTMGMNEKITIQKFKLYSLLNDKKKAYAEVQKYIDKYPRETKYYILLGNLYLQDGKTKEAFTALSKAKAIDPEDPYLITSMANYYQTMNDRPKAEAELRTALFSSKADMDTKIGILTQYIGILQQNKLDLAPANALLDSLMIENPQEANLNLLYGNLLMVQDKKKEANFQYRVYAESDPTNALGWEQLLQSTDVDSIDALIDVCKTAISYLPEEALFYFYLSVGQYQKQEYKEALKTLDQGIGFAEDNPRLLSEFYGQKGSLYYELKQQDSAFVEFDKSLKYNPQNLGVLNNYSYYLSLTHKDLDRAEAMSSITIKAEPTNPTYLDTYGWILFMQKAYTTAKIYIENAVKYSEEKEKEVSPEVLEHYGDVLYMLDDKENALVYWLKAKEKNSESKTLDKKIETKTYIAPNPVN